MPRDLTPEPDERALLASAHADGTLSAEQSRRFDTEPGLRAHAELVAGLRTQLGEPVEVPAAERETAVAAALDAAATRRAPVVAITSGRRWTTPVLTAAAAALLLGVVGVTVLGSGDADEASTARVSDDVAVAAAEAGTPVSAPAADATDGGGNDTAVTPVTIASIDAPASAALPVDDPAGLAALPDPVTAEGSTGAVSYSPAADCLEADQVFLADIVYRGVPAIAVRTADGSTLAVDEQCTVVGEAAP